MPDENRVFDVTKPKNISPSATSRPVIVGHQPRVSDPMMRETKSAFTKISVNDGAPAIIEPTVYDEPPAAQLPQPEPQEDPRPMPQYDPVIPANNPEAIARPMLHDLPEPQPHDHGAHIEGLHLSAPKRKSRLPKYLAVIILLIIAAYLILDSGLISTGINMPFHVFKQKNQPAASASNNNTPSSAAQNTVSAPSTPAGFKVYRIAGTNLTFAAPLAWGDPTSLTDPGYTKRGGTNQSDGTYAYLVNFATNKDIQIAVTSGKYLPAKRTPTYYDYLQWCTGTNDGNTYLSVLHFKTENKVDTPTTVTCDQGPLTSTQKIDDTTVVQSKSVDSQKKVVGDIYIKNLSDPSLVVFRVKDAAMTNGDSIKQLLNTIQISPATQ